MASATNDLGELTGLPDGHKEQLTRGVLEGLGITIHRLQGNELIHGCPVSAYHQDQDRNPTAALNVQNLLWHCLGCGAGGTLLWLIATLRNTEIEQARDWLHGEAGLTRAMELPDLLAFFDSIYTPKKKPPMPLYSERMLDRWNEAGIPDYILNERAIPITTAVHTGICLDPDGWMGPPEARVRTGPRAVIPHRWNGRLVGWQSRRLPGADPTAPKYLSTPGFPRDETLFGHRPHNTWAIPVESPMSVLRHEEHQPLEATFGNVVTDLQIRHLVKGRAKLIWWMDNDEAGWRAVGGRTHNGRFFPGAPQRAAAHCKNYVVQSPFAADPADLSDEIVDILIEQAVPWPVWERPEVLYCHQCFKESHAGQC
ncbi:hypothetical protein ACFQ6C_26305 [Streptomyces sp. NPDC056454]|uniref:hypothetical protein n=1 Tax=Streptomyces sp. NPDC056454 TaxID=3345823 RepID=UPI0036B181A5